MSKTQRVRRGKGCGACDAADREKVICPSVKFATKVFIPKRTKMGGNVSAAKTWQERLSQSGKNMAIAKGRICYLRSMDNYVKQRDAEQRTIFTM